MRSIELSFESSALYPDSRPGEIVTTGLLGGADEAPCTGSVRVSGAELGIEGETEGVRFRGDRGVLERGVREGRLGRGLGSGIGVPRKAGVEGVYGREVEVGREGVGVDEGCWAGMVGMGAVAGAKGAVREGFLVLPIKSCGITTEGKPLATNILLKALGSELKVAYAAQA